MAEFIISTPDQQDRLLHDQRFSSAYVTPKHQQALSVIRSFCGDMTRDWAKFEAARTALVEKSKGSSFTPSQRDEAARCVETLDLFRDHSGNTFGVAGGAFCEPPKFELFNVNGLPVSVYPDLIAGSVFPPDDGHKMGLVFLRVQKRPDPSGCKTETTRETRCSYRREVLSYMLVLGDMMLRANGYDDSVVDRKKFRGWDVRLGEEVLFPSDRVSREKRIEAACGQINRLWQTIDPKPSDLA
ncbi:hypothetical protein [Pseudosulfitobacter pseudonitzschiae]|uniref:hypothetical protein n=1 Tax=Pseudosulfitobacter pseudonitzschiae TaxID=1402135 RepID=UPI001BB68D7D|nr:hypothetical protein [Pseudosulfitobacter pseudonitzschiae]MBM1838134.1 hypothetical protein [Pseudosulfitobacter pseudonitzschiae]MBM1862388.1 hypothetical protein [Pseudosulfitobacter pseudonitzschiae]MBM1867241.1 hypothetical protein [Pseudosulfitobacter pseudonitzschiae]MBM1876890.1 hypothetical protein [Pseudosulfitobacter pseudonitzschiae]MBM1895998.1 hypothetical protein [Pseudosulfitobacter pseudonitzschiae]